MTTKTRLAPGDYVTYQHSIHGPVAAKVDKVTQQGVWVSPVYPMIENRTRMLTHKQAADRLSEPR